MKEKSIILCFLISILFIAIVTISSTYCGYKGYEKGWEAGAEFYFRDANKSSFSRVHYMDLSDCLVIDDPTPEGPLHPYAIEPTKKIPESVKQIVEIVSPDWLIDMESDDYSFFMSVGARLIAAYYSSAYTKYMDDCDIESQKRWYLGQQTLFFNIMAADGKEYSTLDLIWDVYDKVDSVKDGKIYIYRMKRFNGGPEQGNW